MAVRSTPQIPVDTLAALLESAPLLSSEELEEISDDADGQDHEQPTVEIHPLLLERLLLSERATPNNVILLDTPKRRDEDDDVVLLDAPKHGPDDLGVPRLRKGYGFLATCCLGGVALGVMLASLFL